MTETIQIDVPRRGIGSDLAETLAEYGMHAEIVDDGELCALRVRFADGEHDRLVDQAIQAVEAYLSDRMLPLVVQRANGGAVIRPHGD